MFDIFDDMDDFELSFDMASESYLDSVDEEFNEWEDDTANEAVGYDAIKDKVDAALEDFKENLKFAGKVIWESVKKAAKAVIAFFKALPGRIAKLIRQSIDKLKTKVREIRAGKKSANDRAVDIAAKMRKETNDCVAAARNLVKVVKAESVEANKHVTMVANGRSTTYRDDEYDASKDITNRENAKGGNAEAFVRLNENYNKYFKLFNDSFSSVLSKAIGFTKALAKGNANLETKAKHVTTCLGEIVSAFIGFIGDLDAYATSLTTKKGDLAHNMATNKLLGQYRSAVSNFSAKKGRIEEQITYIEHALEQNKANVKKKEDKEANNK